MADRKVDAVLLCGGAGRRFLEVTDDRLPKSLYPINQKELISYTTDSLDLSKIGKLIFAVDHQKDRMIEWISRHIVHPDIVITEQTEPGIVGAVKGAESHIASDHFVLCNTDEVRDGFDAAKFISESFRVTGPSDGTMATALAENLSRHRVVLADEEGVITDTRLKDASYRDMPEQTGLINTGFLYLPAGVIDSLDDRLGNDWSSIIDPLVEEGALYSVPDENVRYFNVGTAAELEDVTRYFNS